jgi:hypothetical protein
LKVDGDDILRLVVLQRGQDALEQIALWCCFSGGNRRLVGDGFLDGLFGFLGRDFFGGFGGGFLGGFPAGGLVGSFTSQGGNPCVSGNEV